MGNIRSRIDLTEDRIYDLEHRNFKITQSGENKENKRMKIEKKKLYIINGHQQMKKYHNHYSTRKKTEGKEAKFLLKK